VPFEFEYENDSELHADDFSAGFARWHHEGVGDIQHSPDGGMRLHCLGSRQGAQACMAFFRPNLPDLIAVEYDITVRSHGGLIINYVAIRGQKGEDLIEDAAKLEPRTGIMANYYSDIWGLQSYHVSVSRFNDKGEHTGTCNFRRNPGSILMCHGIDLVKEIDKPYHIRLVKDAGHVQLFVNGEHALGFVDRHTERGPIPDHGKFGFRLIGSDVKADVANFRVLKLKPNRKVWSDNRHLDTRNQFPDKR
jgi:hypothetical protein